MVNLSLILIYHSDFNAVQQTQRPFSHKAGLNLEFYVEFQLDWCVNKFILYFKITYFDDSYCLDLFLQGSGVENMIQFAENIKRVPKERITEKVKANIRNGLFIDSKLFQHLEYCIENQLDNIAVDLLQYIGDSRINQKMIVDAYLKLNGDLTGLEAELPNIEDYLRFYIFEKLIEKQSPNIESILLIYFHKTGENKLKYAKYLMILENKKAFEFLLDKLENDEVVTTRGFFNPITNKRDWKEVNLLIVFLRLYLLAISNQNAPGYFGIDHDAREMIMQLVRENDRQFEKIRWIMQYYIFTRKIVVNLPNIFRSKQGMKITKEQIKRVTNLWKEIKFEHYANQKMTVEQIKEFL